MEDLTDRLRRLLVPVALAFGVDGSDARVEGGVHLLSRQRQRTSHGRHQRRGQVTSDWSAPGPRATVSNPQGHGALAVPLVVSAGGGGWPVWEEGVARVGRSLTCAARCVAHG